MSHTKDARIASLRPEFVPIAVTWLHIVIDDLRLKARVLETLRSKERQIELETQGRSRVKMGWHNVGLAMDFAVFTDAGAYLTDDATGLYTKCGLIAEALGCVWGGRWENFRDYGHIEYHPGFTLQQFIAGRDGGLVA